jgi:TRAP transporter 4TM/12TM fusion protein
MKKAGYEPTFAGAVEAVASTGGQIMPPVMGAAAFIMAEYMGISYFKVAAYAIIPALLYYTACWVQIHFHSAKIGLKGMKESEIPRLKKVLKSKGQMFIPLIGLIIMIVIGYSPMFSAFFAIIGTIFLSFLRPDTRLTPKTILRAIVDTAKSMAPISISCAVIGIIIGCVSLTGTALLAGNEIVRLAGSSLFLVLFLTMLISIILGMGMPTSAVYMVTATFAAPIIMRFGVPLVAAHFFVFYYGCLSAVTPPVAMCAVIAAGLANSPPARTGWMAGRLAIAGFIVPFAYVYAPGILLQSDNIWDILIPSATAFIGVISLGAALEGFFYSRLNVLKRILLGIASILMIVPERITDFIGLALVIIIIVFNYREKKSINQQSP